mmetsp:Transcript_49871/g.149949  ORF Transcript_49871/g.149949 Transcript_49871/m.149949 type:complete len:84 (-) Transcript_49871:913-1164(-)
MCKIELGPLYTKLSIRTMLTFKCKDLCKLSTPHGTDCEIKLTRFLGSAQCENGILISPRIVNTADRIDCSKDTTISCKPSRFN